MNFLERVQHVLTSEAEAILRIPSDTLINKLPQLAEMILQCKGKVIITGMGKNAHVGKRVAATFSCTGTPAFFLDPAASSHGDIGMVSKGDILIALSNSGRTREVLETVEKIRSCYDNEIKIVVITGHSENSLSRYADISLSYGIIEEPCPLNLTPSASLAVISALLDALALGLMEMRKFTVSDYADRHWSGYIGEMIEQEGIRK